MAKLLYEAAKDGHIDAYDVYDVLGVKRDAAQAFVDPTPEPVTQQVPSSVNGASAAAVAAPSSGNMVTFLHRLVRLVNLSVHNQPGSDLFLSFIIK